MGHSLLQGTDAVADSDVGSDLSQHGGAICEGDANYTGGEREGEVDRGDHVAEWNSGSQAPLPDVSGNAALLIVKPLPWMSLFDGRIAISGQEQHSMWHGAAG